MSSTLLFEVILTRCSLDKIWALCQFDDTFLGFSPFASGKLLAYLSKIGA